jgi:hypothetical protein
MPSEVNIMACYHRPFYNVDGAVGRGKRNASDDVMLVQFFLTEIARKNTGVFKPPDQALQVSGAADENLYAWISAFQNQYSARPDGIVDTARGSAYTRSTITHEIYTIVKLNNAFASLYPERFPDLRKDMTIPGVLRNALSREV